ncbi:MAG TPA: ssDNA-binding protein [Flavobacterium sp.]|nr:ssDNA-binding protein [Flavobacterium sp.]
MATKKRSDDQSAMRVVSNQQDGLARISYAHVFKPTSVAPDKPDTLKYSVVLCIPKKNKGLYIKLKKAKQAAIEWGIENTKEWGGAKPLKKFQDDVIKDGDEDFDLDKNPEYKGCWIISAKSDRKPGVIGKDKEELTTDDEFYSGCFARFDIKFFPYGKVGKGISVQLNNLQKIKDGERLAGKVQSADEAFEDDWEDDDDDTDEAPVNKKKPVKKKRPRDEDEDDDDDLLDEDDD